MKSCPFCGGEVVEHPNPKWKKQYLVCNHMKKCWMENMGTINSDTPYFHNHHFTLIPKTRCYIRSWNKRSKE